MEKTTSSAQFAVAIGAVKAHGSRLMPPHAATARRSGFVDDGGGQILWCWIFIVLSQASEIQHW